MQDIDFLPVEYRQKHARRQSTPWRIVVVVGFGVLVATAAIGQFGRRQIVQKKLATLDALYETAVSQNNQLAESQLKLQEVREFAELYTYLRHPWPRTGLLAAVAAPLPDAVTLTEVRIAKENSEGRLPSDRRSRADQKAEDEKLAALPPAVRDLKRLQAKCDAAPTRIFLFGTTTDSAAVHDFLGVLDRSDFFAKAELLSIESVEHSSDEDVQFQAILIVRPGYGQAGGPAAPDETTLADSDTQPDGGTEP